MNFFNRNKSTTAVVENTFDAPTSAVEDISGDYTIDAAHTRLGFSARHAMVTTVRGQFTEFEGTAHIDTVEASKPRRAGKSRSRSSRDSSHTASPVRSAVAAGKGASRSSSRRACTNPPS